MIKRSIFFLLFLATIRCIEPYDFVVHDDTHTLVVEAYVSDKSFNETRLYPSDGRYFTVKLSYTGDVVNVRPIMVVGALVMLISDQGEEWVYSESKEEPGVYKLLNNEFKALKGLKYKLQISIQDDAIYESSWESLPDISTPIMGDIDFFETEIKKYIVESGEKILKTVKAVSVNIRIPENKTDHQIFYRWKYTPLWIYIAPLSSVSNPGYKCWASDKNYIADYDLQIDISGGYNKDLFFLETVRNERLFEDLSVLVTQYSINQPDFRFWEEMQKLAQGGSINDSPPYNLQTNVHSLQNDKSVSGYFSVVQEQAKRWYFNIEDLSYHVVNTLKGDCLVVYGPGGPAPECLDCREYSFGTTTTTKPSWWRQ